MFVSDGSPELTSLDPFEVLGPDGDRDSLNPLRFEAYGLGVRHFEDRVLGRMGRLGNGGAFFYRSPELVGEYFDATNWRRSRIPFGERVRWQISINPDTTLGQLALISRENLLDDVEFGEDRPDLSAIPAGTQFMMFLFVELHEPARPGQELHVGQVEVRWLTPRLRETNRQELQLIATVSEWGQDPHFALGGIVAMSTYLYGFFGDELVTRDDRLLASWALKELLQLFDQLPEDLRLVEANDRFRRYLLEMVDYGNEYLLEPAEPGELQER